MTAELAAAPSTRHAAEPQRHADTDRLQLGPLDSLLGYHLAHAVVATTQLFERHIGAPFGLGKVEYSMLMLILHNGPLAPKRLARSLALTPPKMTLLLDRMQARGLLRRERSELDRRSQNVVLTPQGERIASSSAAAAAASEDALDRRLSRAERAMLVELLHKLSDR